MTTPADRSLRLPLYEQVKDGVLARIRSGELPVGAQLPSEAELCAEYGVSRIVVRQALNDLTSLGYVDRRQGKGTFVTEPKVHARFLDRPSSFFGDLASLGYRVTSKTLECVGRPAGDAAGALHLRPADPVVSLRRLRSVDGELFAITQSLLPAWLGPDLLEVLTSADMEHRSLDDVLLESCGTRIVSAFRSVEATLADRTVARVLGTRPGAAILYVRSVGLDSQDRPVELYEAWHRGDRALFEILVGGEPSNSKASLRTVRRRPLSGAATKPRP